MKPAECISYTDLVEGMAREQTYTITPVVYESFMGTFDDRSPVHVDSAYAKACGFSDVVMHGSILNGFASHFVGMIMPGASSLLLSVDLRFLQPSYLGDTLRLEGKVAQKLDVQRVIVLHLTFHNQTRSLISATGRAQVKVRDT